MKNSFYLHAFINIIIEATTHDAKKDKIKPYLESGKKSANHYLQ